MNELTFEKWQQLKKTYGDDAHLMVVWRDKSYNNYHDVIDMLPSDPNIKVDELLNKQSIFELRIKPFSASQSEFVIQ